MMRHCRTSAAIVMGLIAGAPGSAQERSADNAVTQAEDAFGFSVGRESLGIYSAGSVRGFSPTAAGNVRVEGLFFDPVVPLSGLLVDSTSVRVGLAAQGFAFVAPSGIVDQKLRRPGDQAGASVLVNADDYGSFGVEVTGTLPVSSRLSLGYGASASQIGYADGTDGLNHAEALIARWQPIAGVEILPFWSLANDYDNEAGPYYLPAGNYLPPQPRPRRFDGPEWVDFRGVSTNHGVLASAAFGRDWLVRIGVFRSVNDQRTGYANLLTDLRPDGSAERVVIADPRSISRSRSGEARLLRSVVDGGRLHTLQASYRIRDARREFGGSVEVDLGPTRLGEPVAAPRPDFVFGPLTRQRIRQSSVGGAYDLRWKGVGEFSLSASRASYQKTTLVPGAAPVVSRSSPWVYNGTAALLIGANIIAYAGYARGLEESGLAPQSASNRNQPLTAIITEQKDAGVRIALTPGLKAVAGVFDLRRPYFGFDASRIYQQVGQTRSRGAEFSLAGRLTPRLSLVAGATLFDARVERDAFAIGTVGRRPVGVPDRLATANFNWRTPFARGLSLDAAISHRGPTAATVDNLVRIPARERVDLGGRYAFKLAGNDAVLRVQLRNLFDVRGFATDGPGVYAPIQDRALSGYLAIDF